MYEVQKYDLEDGWVTLVAYDSLDLAISEARGCFEENPKHKYAVITQDGYCKYEVYMKEDFFD